jgi:tetratricopeptide (TPR) repeat protein
MRRLHDAWGGALRALFQHYTPIFIGYGGNDDTLMDLLESLQSTDIKGQLLWCYYEAVKPSERIRNLVAGLGGILIPVPDFDLLMVLMGEKMGIGLLDLEIQKRADARVEQYRNRIKFLDTVKHPSVAQALAKTFERSGGWFPWVQKADAEKDLARRDIVYRQGIYHCATSPQIHTAFANFLTNIRKDHDQAETYFKKALKLGPTDQFTVGSYTLFLQRVRTNYDEAERLYKKTIEKHPDNSVILGAYGVFLWEVRGRAKEAEALFRRALDQAPSDASNVANFAEFLLIHGRNEEADEYLRKARRLDATSGRANTGAIRILQGVLARVKGEDDSSYIEQLRTTFSENITPVHWNFENLLAFVRTHVSPADHALYSSLTARLKDPAYVIDVDALLKIRRPKSPIVLAPRSTVGARKKGQKVHHRKQPAAETKVRKRS